MKIRVVHRSGETKTLDAGGDGNHVYLFWPIAGWYRVFLRSGRIAGAKSWHVCEEDLPQLKPPPRPRKKKGQPQRERDRDPDTPEANLRTIEREYREG